MMKPILFCVFLFNLFLRLSGQEHVQSLETPFEHLKVTGNIHLVLEPSNTQTLVLEADQNPQEITVESRENELFLKAKTELNKGPAIVARLHYKTLSRIEVTKGGNIQTDDTLRTGFLELKAETGGKAELRIVTDSLSARVNQGADIILYGRTGKQTIDAYTWGNYLSYDLDASDTYVKAATGAQVKVNARQVLDCNATSKATVGYWGNPKQKNFKTSVGGEVIQLIE